jgi:hypothetical protein
LPLKISFIRKLQGYDPDETQQVTRTLSFFSPFLGDIDFRTILQKYFLTHVNLFFLGNAEPV